MAVDARAVRQAQSASPRGADKHDPVGAMFKRHGALTKASEKTNANN
jgi:hypothetical protein